MDSPNPYQSPLAADSPGRTTPDKWKRWEKTRAKGRKRFIWLHGVVGWGVTVAIFWSFWMGATRGWDQFPLLLSVALVAFPIGGYFWGAGMWRSFERRYQREIGVPVTPA